MYDTLRLTVKAYFDVYFFVIWSKIYIRVQRPKFQLYHTFSVWSSNFFAKEKSVMTDKPVAGPRNGCPTKAYGVLEKGKPLQHLMINRRKPDEHDICIEIKYCGICRSDVHSADNDWGDVIYPMIPGHEIVGRVIEVGSSVVNFRTGDYAGVGPMCDSCRHCRKCKRNEQQYCDAGGTLVYNSPYVKDNGAITCGGFSEKLVVDENYAVKISDTDNLDKIAPLLCAGITVYSPLKYLQANERSRVAIVGFGGLGHIALKIAKAMKADVSIISRSTKKKEAAMKQGVRNFISLGDKHQMTEFEAEFDIILDTASGKHDLNELIKLLDVDGTIVMLGAPPEPFSVYMMPLTLKRKQVMGSCIGSPQETQEMINFCNLHKIYADIDLIPVDKINAAFKTLSTGDITHRFVVDISSLK